MLQEILRIPGLDIPIYGYGLMLVIGFLAATELAKFLARRTRIQPEVFVNAGLIALISGVIGSRLSHVLENWSDYTRPEYSFFTNLWNAVNIRNGGLTFYGGLILGTICVLAYGFWKRVPVRAGMDVVAPAIMVGLAFGRVGCFLNGCCYGQVCEAPWAVSFPYHSSAYQDQVDAGDIHLPRELVVTTASGGQRMMTPQEAKRAGVSDVAKEQRSLHVHPTQLYSSLDAFLVAGVLVAYFSIPHAPGRVFALMLLLMGPIRFLTEMVRSEPPVMWIGSYGLSFSMALSIVFVVTGTILWVAFGRYGSREEWNRQVGLTTAAAPAAAPAMA